MRAHVADAEKDVLDCASCAIGLELTAPIVLRRCREGSVSCMAIRYEIQEGSQS